MTPARPTRAPGYQQPSDWKRTRARIFTRDAGRCHVCGQHGANEIDHVVPVAEGGTHNDANLAPIHAHPCHTTKTERERQRGVARRARRRPQRRPANLIDD